MTTGGSNESTSQKPNVLVILVDQLRFDVFSPRGNPVVDTPHIDRLTCEGAAACDPRRGRLWESMVFN